MNKLTAEKCREQFEEWGKSQRCELDKWVRGDRAGEYKNPVVAKMCQAWEASRDALPILEQQERGEDSDDTFIVMRNPGKVPFIKRPTGDVAEYLLQLYQHNPKAVCDVVTYRYAGASGQWVQDGRELLAEIDIEIPAADLQELDEGEWKEWGGGAMPVSEIEFVEYRMRDGFSDSCFADDIRWHHKGGGFDIIAYRIIPERATNQNGEQ